MIDILSKPANQIDRRDIELLIDSKIPEGDQIEFKEALSTKGTSTDSWNSGGKEIDRKAKESLLQEAVAFANAQGGVLLLGLLESKGEPPVADEISPVPRCADLAERLKLVFRDCVEPQLPQIEIFAVPMDGENGVVVIRAGRSRLAPHRVKSTLVCPIRRADRCEKMTMREIQDMTLDVARGLERLEKRLSERSARFQQEFKLLETPDDSFGIRLSAAPVGDEIRFDCVYRNGKLVEGLSEPWHKVSYLRKKHGTRIGRDGRVRSVDEFTLQKGYEKSLLDDLEDYGIVPSIWRPMLRTARAEPGIDRMAAHRVRNSYREIHHDGLIEWGFVSIRNSILQGSRHPLFFSPNLSTVMFANLAIWADRVRRQGNAPAAEYALEVEICVKGDPLPVRVGGQISEIGVLQPGLLPFPRYPLGSTDEIIELVKLFDRDFWNALGNEIDPRENDLTIEGWLG